MSLFDRAAGPPRGAGNGATTTADASARPRARQPAGSEDGGAKFDYHRHWLVGQRLVLWCDASAGAWRAMADECPHRLAPLSEGLLAPGGSELECAYHGWRFDGCGRCTRMPQAISAAGEASACGSRRSRAAAFPVREGGGLIWVWANAGDDDAAAAAQLPMTRALREHCAAGGRVDWYRRVLPYSWDVAVENLTDPAHLPHSHHGTMPGLRRELAVRMPFTRLPLGDADNNNTHNDPARAPGAAPGGAPPPPPPCAVPGADAAAAFEFPSVQSERGACAFTPPCTIGHDYYAPGGAVVHQQIFASPSAPGRTIVIAGTIERPPPRAAAGGGGGAPARAAAAAAAALLEGLRPAPPAWRSCLSYNLVFDQDNAFLHKQDLLLKARGPGAWRSYYTPLQSDGLIAAARRWIQGVGGGGPDYGGQAAPLPELTKRQVNDRWAQHTAECTHCTAAAALLRRRVAFFRAAAAALSGLLWGLLGALAAAGAAPPPAGAALAAAAAAAGAAGAAWAAARGGALLREFDYVDFSHARNP
ncbi:MAG: hypothetical protein J3K34DRAFT_515066 [Monoraphidium minutum]|nr:MAG: hypothetical protein J3K34DRAFT_515066 [Monoraphidium minutum]